VNWEAAEEIAQNPQTGERLARVRGSWVPISEAATDGRSWMIVQGGAPKAPPAPATGMQKFQSSIPGRIVQGARDGIDAGAQLLPRALEQITSVGGALPNPVSRFMGSQARRVDAMNAEGEQTYQAARTATGQEGFDGARLLGNVISPVNAAAARLLPIAAGLTVPQLAMRGAGQGAVGGMLAPVNDPAQQENFWGNKAGQAGLGAITGGVLTPAIGKGSEALIRRVMPAGGSETSAARISLQVDESVRNALREINQDPAALTQQAITQLRQQATAALQQGKQLDLAAQLRKNDFQELGIKPLQGQISRDPMQYARELNLRGIEGVGEPITARLVDQRRSLTDVLRKFSGGSTERAEGGQSMIDALQAADDQMRTRISGLYNTARASSQADLNIPLQGLAQDAQRVIDDFGDNVPGAVVKKINDLGLFAGTQRKVFTLKDSDDLLKVINANDPGRMNAPVHRALGDIRAALKRAIDDALPAEGNPYRPAVQAASDRFRLIDAVPALKAAANDTANEDVFVRKYILQARPTEVQGLAEVLRSQSPETAQQARAQVGAFLERAAFGQNQAGDKAFAAERFASALDQLGTARLRAFFSPDEIKQLRTLGRVGAYIGSEPGAAAVNRSNTAGAATNILSKIIGMVPGGGALTSIGQSIAAPVINNSRVANAMAAEVPQTAANLTPEQTRALAVVMRNVGVAAGVAGASPLR